jgi:hypothetical protein
MLEGANDGNNLVLINFENGKNDGTGANPFDYNGMAAISPIN